MRQNAVPVYLDHVRHTAYLKAFGEAVSTLKCGNLPDRSFEDRFESFPLVVEKHELRLKIPKRLALGLDGRKDRIGVQRSLGARISDPKRRALLWALSYTRQRKKWLVAVKQRTRPQDMVAPRQRSRLFVTQSLC